ncbi:MAG: ABC transporter ATP-binding protein [SAR324 cluster bacterium]|jgi:oligopeptide transport system ATP-binding protein|nr:ABC transporter ATP-binding protein [SAR324 cluster bacterium]MEE1575362.1 ABC transporter ATP-binding protein [Deltaproteobacteria bacterium]MDP6246929.1 ABC transporter ATP-binding protein [SAR324 cluster bacterium]MDP6463819.1 ABC transporter ATP-binding protein [SAR324 cluster bacterium]MDP7138023.1 ABC transporter ATP-binding protein [SAR324 cluster bacterium]|tara:strand:- start:5655 stop:6620 length:966 start_codon:yes stop_codon:yes gene_type:complete
MSETVLEVNNLTASFQTLDGEVKAVNGISYELKYGEILGIVGESGSGKSVGVMSLTRLIPPKECTLSGEVIFQGENLLNLHSSDILRVRGDKISMIFQDPMTSLNPVLTIGEQISETIIHHKKVSESEARKNTLELLHLVGIPDVQQRIKKYPHQFSGGMRQRVMIAMGLACKPAILIADEPTTALDVTIQAQIIDLIKKIKDDIGMSVIWITHDLGIIAGLAQRVLVMYAGKIVEEAPVEELYAKPLHPYTQGLLNSLPRLDGSKHEELSPIEGLPPNLIDYPQKCPFFDRCGKRKEICSDPPVLKKTIYPEHLVSCHLY